MFKKTIKYEDFNGVDREEDFYFHLSKAELIEMAAGGDLQERLERIIATKDNRSIFDEFRRLLRLAAGVRSADGKTFDKSPEAKARLMDSPAFDELVLELCMSANAAMEFVQNLLPEKMQKELREKIGTVDNTQSEDGRNVMGNVDKNNPRPQWLKENRKPTDMELREMSTEELQLAFRHWGDK